MGGLECRSDTTIGCCKTVLILICSPTIFLYGDFFSSKVDAAHRFLNDMITSGMVPMIVSFNTLIDGFCRVGRLEDVVKVFNHIKEKELASTVITYTTLIKGFYKEHHVDEVLEYFK